MKKHPTAEEITRLLLQDPADPAAAETVRHFASGCGRCAQARREIQTVLAALSAPPLTDAPGAVLSRALAWLEQRESVPTTTQAARSGLETAGSAARRAASNAVRGLEQGLRKAARAAREVIEVQAALVFDTAAGSLVPGIRGAAAPAATRQMMFESEMGQVVLRIESAARGAYRVLGQFLPGEAVTLESGEVRLVHGSRSFSSPMNASGEFAFDSVPAGQILLRIQGGGMQLHLIPIHLAQKSDG